MRFSVLFIFFIFLISFFVKGQIVLSENDNMISAKKSSIRFCIKDGQDISDSSLYSTFTGNWESPYNKKISLKYAAQTIWLKVPLRELNKNIRWLCIKDPHVNIIQVWLLKNGNIVKKFPTTGDHFPFKSRKTSDKNFVFPIPVENYDSCELIIAADKRHTKKILSVFFYSDEKYFSESQSSGLLNGILIGLSLILLIYNCYLFLIIKQKVFQWYSIYLFLILLYFLSDMGFLFEYLYPKIPQLNDMLRIVIISGSLIPFLLFMNEMLELKKYNPTFHKINRSILIFFSIVFIIGNISATSGSFQVQEFWLNFYRIISAIIMIIITGGSFICMIKNTPYSRYTTLSLMCLLAMTLLYISYENDWIRDNFFTENAVYLGISGEILIMTMAIAARFNSFKKSTELLLIEKTQQQEVIMKSITEFKENEMSRFSSMLHDNVGAKLSAIRLNLDNIVKKEKTENTNDRLHILATDISALADEVRSFSHELSPLLLQKKGLISTIKQLVNSINSSGKINIQFESIGSLHAASYPYEIMTYNIMHELLQNMIKHAAADFGIVQIMIEEKLISIYVEDNGKGFDKTNTPDGLGFSQIRKLMSFVNGIFAIESEPGKGCKISLEFKISNYEEA